MTQLPSSQVLALARGWLHYDPFSGVFYWLVNKTGGVRAGAVAGVKQPGSRYAKVQVGGKSLLAHRLAWAMFYGSWPAICIDHINGDTGDNRIDNLRDVSSSENSNNRACHRSGKLFGAHWLGRSNKWQASYLQNGSPVYLGLFLTAQEAHDAVMAHKRKTGKAG